MGRLQTTIERKGQPYVDEPVYVCPKAESKITEAVALAFNPRLRPRMPIVTGHNRVRLNWIKPQ